MEEVMKHCSCDSISNYFTLYILFAWYRRVRIIYIRAVASRANDNEVRSVRIYPLNPHRDRITAERSLNVLHKYKW